MRLKAVKNQVKSMMSLFASIKIDWTIVNLKNCVVIFMGLFGLLGGCGGGGGGGGGGSSSDGGDVNVYTGEKGPATAAALTEVELSSLFPASTFNPASSYLNAGGVYAFAAPILNSGKKQIAQRVSESSNCSSGGSLSFSGDVESTSISGEITFSQCRSIDGSTLDGVVNVKIYDVDDSGFSLGYSRFEIAYHDLSAVNATKSSSQIFTGTVTLLNTYSQSDIPSGFWGMSLREFTRYNLVVTDTVTQQQIKLENYVTFIVPRTDSSRAVSVQNGRVYRSLTGYYDVSTRVPGQFDQANYFDIKGAGPVNALYAVFDWENLGLGESFLTGLLTIDTDGDNIYDQQKSDIQFSGGGIVDYIQNNRAPIIFKDLAQTALVGQATPLICRFCVDEDGDAFYAEWSVLEAPDGSVATLNNPSSVMPGFIPDKAGLYRFSINLKDKFSGGNSRNVVFYLVALKLESTYLPVLPDGFDFDYSQFNNAYRDGNIMHQYEYGLTTVHNFQNGNTFEMQSSIHDTPLMQFTNNGAYFAFYNNESRDFTVGSSATGAIIASHTGDSRSLLQEDGTLLTGFADMDVQMVTADKSVLIAMNLQDSICLYALPDLIIPDACVDSTPDYGSDGFYSYPVSIYTSFDRKRILAHGQKEYEISKPGSVFPITLKHQFHNTGNVEVHGGSYDPRTDRWYMLQKDQNLNSTSLFRGSMVLVVDQGTVVTRFQLPASPALGNVPYIGSPWMVPARHAGISYTPDGGIFIAAVAHLGNEWLKYSLVE